jgi:dolichol-phosphate mannosyltransferase
VFWACFFALGLLAGGILYPKLSYPLIEPDEGRYAEISREMLTSGDWLVPQLDHEPFYDKPPLFFWLVAGSFKLLGTHEWVARLTPATATLLALLATFCFGTSMFGTRAGFLSACMLTLTIGYMELGRVIILDSLLACFVAVSLFTAYAAIRGPQLNWRWWVASAVACALAILAKGPVAFVLLCPPVVAYCWLNGCPSRPSLRNWLAYAGIASGLAAPWYLAVLIRDPRFAYHFFVEHHLARFLTAKFHEAPFWFYVPVLALGFLPWSILFPSFATFLCSRSLAVRSLRTAALGFVLLWCGWVVLFFSLSSGKLAPYMLPAAPAIALALGYFLECVLFRAEVSGYFGYATRVIPRCGLVMLAGAWLAASYWTWRTGLILPRANLLEPLKVAACVAVIAGVAVWGRRLTPKTAWALCGIFSFFFLVEIADQLVPAWSLDRSPLAKAAEVKSEFKQPDFGVAYLGEEWGSIPFRLGNDHATFNGTMRSSQELLAFLGEHPRNFLIVKPDINEHVTRVLEEFGVQLHRRAESSRALIYVVESVSAKAP